MIFVLITVLLDVMALGLIIPVWPELVVGFTHSVADAGLWMGLASSMWSLIQFVCQPVFGALSDRFGRRPVILASNFGTGVDYILMALAPALSWLFVGRLISAVTASSVGAATAYIADVSRPEDRARNFGAIGAIFGLGFIIGPGLGGVLGDAGHSLTLPGGLILHGDPRLPFWVAAGLSLLNAAYGFFVLPESLPRDKRDSFSWAKANPIGSFRLLTSNSRLGPFAIVIFLLNFAHYVLQTVFVLYASSRYHWTPFQLGLVMVLVGVCSAVVQGGLTGPVVRRLGERRAILIGMLSALFGFAIFGFAPTGAVFMAGVPVLALWGMAGPSVQSLMSRMVGPSDQGKLSGAVQSVAAIGGVIGPIVYGGLFGLFNGPWKSLGVPGAPFFFASLLMAINAALAMWATAHLKPGVARGPEAA